MTDQPSLLSALITKAVVEIEDQKIPISLDLAKSDDVLRRALAPVFPGAANAKIERREEGDTLFIKVIKLMGTKGQGPLEKLVELPESRNTAVEMYREIAALKEDVLTPEILLSIDEQISEAIAEGEDEAKLENWTENFLLITPPIPSTKVVHGF